MAATAHAIHWLGSLVARRAETRARHRPLSAEASAVPLRGAAVKALLRVYRGSEGRWYVRREGGVRTPEAGFAARLAAIEFARLLGMAAGSYRILFETRDGSILEERFIPH